MVQVSVLASQERLQYVAAFGDKKEYIALLELQLNKARYSVQCLHISYHMCASDHCIATFHVHRLRSGEVLWQCTKGLEAKLLINVLLPDLKFYY